jgi:hypothetical protein
MKLNPFYLIGGAIIGILISLYIYRDKPLEPLLGSGTEIIKESVKEQYLTVYTTQAIYYVDIANLEITEENADYPIYKASSFIDLENWFSIQTARDANISDAIPIGAFTLESYKDKFPVVNVLRWNKTDSNKYKVVYDTIGWIIADDSFINYQPFF